MISRPFRTAAALLLVSLLGACTSTEADPPDASVDAAQETPAPAAVERYVALGDSYTAAPLIAGTELERRLLPLRQQLPVAAGRGARRRHARRPQLQRRHHREHDGPSAEPVRRQALAAAVPGLTRDTDLVTLGIGGNDFDVFSNLTGLCPRLRPSDPTGNPCQQVYSSSGTDTLLRDAGRIKARVAGVIRGIRKRAPEARIVVVDYPRVVPTTGTCPRRLPLADGDYRWAARVTPGSAPRCGAPRSRPAPSSSTCTPPAPGTTSAPTTRGSTAARPSRAPRWRTTRSPSSSVRWPTWCWISSRRPTRASRPSPISCSNWSDGLSP